MSAKDQKRTWRYSFYHLVCSGEYVRRDFKSNRFGGFEVDDEPVRCWLLKWQIARFLAAQNTVDVGSGLTKHRVSIRTVGRQSPCYRKCRVYGDRGHAMTCQQGRHLRVKRQDRCVWRKKNATIRLLRHACDGAFDIRKIVNGQIDRLNCELPCSHFKCAQIVDPNRIVWVV